MAIRLLSSYVMQSANTIVTDISYSLEKELVELGMATFDLTGGVLQVNPTYPKNITENEIAILDYNSKNAISNANDFTGWRDYTDTQYTEGSPLQLVANTRTILPNNAMAGPAGEQPIDFAEFYDGAGVLGRLNDALIMKLRFKAKPTSAGTTFLEFDIDIGGSVGIVDSGFFTFPKGTGVERRINSTILLYTLNTWETNKGTVNITANGTCDIYEIGYVFGRLHKAR